MEVYERYSYPFITILALSHILQISRDPQDSTSLKLFDGPVNFVPVQSPSSTFKLALRHVVPRLQILDGIDPDTTQQFSIEYEDTDLEEAITVMEKKNLLQRNLLLNQTKGAAADR